jgi:hypothetical protein
MGRSAAFLHGYSGQGFHESEGVGAKAASVINNEGNKDMGASVDHNDG